MNRNWEALYDLQNRVIARMSGIEQGFYLTGGTALSRGYYGHRYSEDLDFFVNYSPSYGVWRDNCFAVLEQASKEEGWSLEISLRGEYFGRAFVHGAEVLKLEFVNDVPSRVGVPWRHPVLGMLDTRENILANKITAFIDRRAAKDAADLYWLCCEDGLNIMDALVGASGKAAGIFPPYVAKELDRWSTAGVPNVMWLKRPEPTRFAKGFSRLVEMIMADDQPPTHP